MPKPKGTPSSRGSCNSSVDANSISNEAPWIRKYAQTKKAKKVKKKGKWAYTKKFTIGFEDSEESIDRHRAIAAAE